MKMSNKSERVKMVKAMEFIARQVNDEEVFEPWLVGGVADGDIEYGDTAYQKSDTEELEYYLRDEEFRDLMDTFLRLMRRAYSSGGLYCDGIVTKQG